MQNKIRPRSRRLLLDAHRHDEFVRVSSVVAAQNGEQRAHLGRANHHLAAVLGTASARRIECVVAKVERVGAHVDERVVAAPAVVDFARRIVARPDRDIVHTAAGMDRVPAAARNDGVNCVEVTMRSLPAPPSTAKTETSVIGDGATLVDLEYAISVAVADECE